MERFSYKENNTINTSTTWTKTWIWCILLTAVTLSVVILAIYIQQGLQQKQEDLCLVNESPYQNEDVNNVQTLTNRGNPKEYKVFREFFDKLANILPVANLINKLIAAEIINFEDSEEIKALPKSQDKASFVLNKVEKSLKADITDDFYSLLSIMEEYGGAVAKVATKIREKLK